MTQIHRFNQAIMSVYPLAEKEGHLVLTEGGHFHHLTKEGKAVACYEPLTSAAEAEYFQPAGLQNGKFEAACVVHAPDSFLVIIEFEKMLSDPDYEPDLIDFSEHFGTKGFYITGSPDGEWLALYPTDQAGVLVLPVQTPTDGQWIELADPPECVWLLARRVFASAKGNVVLSAEF